MKRQEIGFAGAIAIACGLIGYGVSLISEPAAWIFAGVAVAILAVLIFVEVG